MISALPGPTQLFSPRDFLRGGEEKITALTAANSIGNIYSLVTKYHFGMITRILKPTNTRSFQKLRATVVVP
jgi:hypothetical protein